MKGLNRIGLLLLLLVFTAGAVFAGGSQEQAEEDDQIVLEVWHGATNRDDPAHAALFKVLEDFEAMNPNVTIVESGQTTDNLKTKIRAAAAANELPDVFFTWGYRFSEDMGKTGLLLDISPYLDAELTAKLKPGALDAATYNGKPYGLPDNGWIEMIYFNTILFDKYGLEIPTTIDELIAVSKVFRENGVQPLVVGGKQNNTILSIWERLSCKLVGAEMLNASYTDASVLDDPRFLQAAEIIYRLGEEKVFADTCYNFVNPDAANAFTTGTYAMAGVNAGFVGLFEGPKSKIAGHIEAVPNIVNIDGVENYEKDNVMGFPGQWVIGSRTEAPDEAFALMSYISQSLSKNFFEDGTHQIAYSVPEWDASNQSKLYKSIDEMSKSFNKLVMAGGESRSQSIGPDLSNIAIALSMNKITPEEFIAQMKELTDQ